MKKILLILAMGFFVLGGLGLVYAQQQANSDTSKQNSAAAPAKLEVVNVGNKVCPVTDEKITDKEKITYEYKGKIYNFCCPSCVDSFKKDPDKFIKKIEEQKQAESHEK